jgi:septal ring-binding cell division protein DamX
MSADWTDDAKSSWRTTPVGYARVWTHTKNGRSGWRWSLGITGKLATREDAKAAVDKLAALAVELGGEMQRSR